MQLDYAISYIETNYPTLKDKDKQNLLKALTVLEHLLCKFEDTNLDKLYQIEMINPDYFPGLSTASAKTLCDLNTANPQLEMSFLLEVVGKLALRGRPWESLGAFSRVAQSCPKQITQENINYLQGIPSLVLEVWSYDFEKKMRHNFFKTAEVDIPKEVRNKATALGYH